jgi:hypothetical protein
MPIRKQGYNTSSKEGDQFNSGLYKQWTFVPVLKRVKMDIFVLIWKTRQERMHDIKSEKKTRNSMDGARQIGQAREEKS